MKLSPRKQRALWIGAVVIGALLVLLPRLGGPGLWEPDEMKVADDAAMRADRTLGKVYSDTLEKKKTHSYQPPPVRPDCPKTALDDNGARELTANLIADDIAWFGSSEFGMRIGLAVLALLAVLATAGTASRIGGPRAGAIAGLVLLSFPLLVMQGRQLTSQIGTAAGAAMIVYGLVAVAHPRRGLAGIPDLLLATASTVLGCMLAFLGGGALLGLVPPFAAVALAGGLGLAAITAAGRAGGTLALGALPERFRIGRDRSWPRPPMTAVISLLAFGALLAVAWILFHQLYDLQNRAPGTREIFGKSFVPRECWSEALGGIWKAHDDGTKTYDAIFEQAAFGMFPWSVLAPVALIALLGGDEPRRYAGRLTLAWTAIAWTTATIFERKVGFAVFAGFPACAIALGLWLDGLVDRVRADAARGSTGPGDPSLLLIGLWALVGMFVLGKDVAAFPEKMASLALEGTGLKFPDVRFLGIHPQSWALALAWLVALSFTFAVWAIAISAETRHSWHAAIRSLAPWGLYVALGLTGVVAIFWAQIWQPTVSSSLSSKDVFALYRELHHDGERLGIMGDIGNAPRYYADGPWDPIRSKDELVNYVEKPDQRTFALAPSAQICEIHNAFGGKPYVVLDDSNARFMLLSNQGEDRSPLPRMMTRDKPDKIQFPFEANYDNQIELIGYDMPHETPLGGSFQMTLYFHVLAKVTGNWTIFVHFDPSGGSARFQGDHPPIGGRCATTYWEKDTYIVDTFTVDAGDITLPTGSYKAYVGFFTGTNPNWKNMKVTSAPPGAKDDADRVLIGTIQVN